MENLIYKFIVQLEEATIMAEIARIRPHPINMVFITGMGGSGIAGRFVAEIMKIHGKVPVIVSNGYDVPKWIDENTLAIVSSYSGNTEETLGAFEKLIIKKAKIVTISSGGNIMKRTEEEKLDFIRMPGDWGSPRACIGYSVIFQLYILFKCGILSLELTREMSIVVEHLINQRDHINKKAAEIAMLINGKIPLIYSDQAFEPLAIRFRQQLNENSKIHAFNAVFPEMNHNEIAAWTYPLEDFAALFIMSPSYYSRTNKRIEISKEIMIRYIDTMIDIEMEGHTMLQQIFYGIHLIDWISWFVAQRMGVDAMEIANIDYLKWKLDNS
jgi:glucose/mannose-6-phosphate isomerase